MHDKVLLTLVYSVRCGQAETKVPWVRVNSREGRKLSPCRVFDNAVTMLLFCKRRNGHTELKQAINAHKQCLKMGLPSDVQSASNYVCLSLIFPDGIISEGYDVPPLNICLSQGFMPTTVWLSHVNDYFMLARLSQYNRSKMQGLGHLCTCPTFDIRHHLQTVSFKGGHLCLWFKFSKFHEDQWQILYRSQYVGYTWCTQLRLISALTVFCKSTYF